MPPRPLKFKDVEVGKQYVVIASCVNSGALDCLFVQCAKASNNDDLRFIRLRPPNRNGTNFSRPMFSPEDIGLTENGKPKSDFLWRTFSPDRASAEILTDIVVRQDKAAYRKLLAAS